MLDRLQWFFCRAGSIIATGLLLRFAIDFSAEMPGLLAACFWLLVTLSIGAMVWNQIASSKASQPVTDPAGGEAARRPWLFASFRIGERRARGWLIAAIPAGFLVSSLDCTGLALEGCSAFCAFVKLVWVPAIGLVCISYALTGARRSLLAVTMMCFVPLVPHCVCRNAANAWWIDGLGASPECYIWGFTVSVIAATALSRSAPRMPSLIVCGLIVSGALAFFVGHHYLGFPW
jgi:hypothetical protein